jgi:hypothetical protein
MVNAAVFPRARINHHLRSKYFRTCDQGVEPPLDDGNESSDDFRCTPDSGHRRPARPCPKSARSRHMRRSKSHHSITPPGQMACDALTAVARCFVLSLDSEQVVTKKAVRLHCHSVPSSGSDTACGRPTATAAPAATIATAAIASVLDLCQMNLMAFSDLRGLKSALCRHDSLRASSPLRNRTTGTSLPRTSAPLAPVTMSDSALAGFSPRRLRQGRPPD